MTRRFAAVLAALTLMGQPALAQPAVQAAAPAGPEFSTARLSEHIRILSSDEFEGRAPATPGEYKTIQYLIAAYREMGLEPGGPGGSWVQPVNLLRFTPDNAAATASFTARGQVTTLKFSQDFTGRARNLAGKAQVAGGAIVFVGYGISAPDRGWDDLAGMDLTGKTVLFLGGEPDSDQKTGPFEGEAATLFGRPGHKREAFARRGAIGAIQISQNKPDSPAWKDGASQADQPMLIIAPSPGVATLAYSATFNADVSKALLASAGIDLDAAKAEAKKAGFRAKPLEGVSLALGFAATIDTIQTYNVLARVKGRTHPNETVLFTGHWDHLGKADTPDAKGDVIYNGAWDNGSGTAAILELARGFANGPRPDRSVVFINFTAEESGLLGSEYYTEHPVWPLATTAALFDLDMPPLMGRTRDIEVLGFGKSDLEDDLAAAAARRGMVIVPDTTPSEGYYYRSDHFPFAQKGVPALMTWGGRDLLDGGAEAGGKERTRMLEVLYHDRADEWRPDTKLDGTVDLLHLYYEIAQTLTNTRRWPQWKPGAEFKAARDPSADKRK